MNKEQLLRELTDILVKIQTYNLGENRKVSGDRRVIESSDLRKSLQESVQLGAPGQPCPYCGGSGRA